MWIESVWQEPGRALYAWYHHERIGVCPKLNVPEIGALVSRDGGESFTDLGIILSSGEWTDCSARNGYFANGHGDFSVIADRDREYFYFLFGAYGGDVSNQGITIARMPFGNVSNPVGNVWKYHQGAWSEPGIGGPVTPVLPAAVSWREADTDSFWGPSIHWNDHLRRYVVLMNRSFCWPGWPQEGVYITMNANLSDPSAWTQPKKFGEFGPTGIPGCSVWAKGKRAPRPVGVSDCSSGKPRSGRLCFARKRNRRHHQLNLTARGPAIAAVRPPCR